MTTAQIEHLREAIAMKDVSFEDMVLSMSYALDEARQALDYEDWSHAQVQAQYVADVLKTMERR